MNIEYIEARNKNREVIGIIDDFISIIWHKMYYGVGDFEIYAQATKNHIDLLKEANYITRPNDDMVGIIEKVKITTSAQDGDVIVASGRFAKSILDRRLICKYNKDNYTNQPTVMRGNVEENIRKVVKDNAISCGFNHNRDIPILALGSLSNLSKIIVDEGGDATERQVSYQNLLSYTDEMLQEYEYGAKILLNDDSKLLEYKVYSGEDRTIENKVGNSPVIFSQDYDNLVQGDYENDTTAEKNVALTGGEGEGLERFYSIPTYDDTRGGLSRRELFVDASSLSSVLPATDLQYLFPTGSFVGVYFVVNTRRYAEILVESTSQYSLETLKEKFPSGVTNGIHFDVDGLTYATLIYGEEDKYTLTQLGYKAMLDVDGTVGNYKLYNFVYSSMLDDAGRKQLSLLNTTTVYKGTINVTFGNWVLNRDYFLGDLVTIQDNKLGLYMNARITEVTEVQDENGYTIDVVYE